MKHLKLFEDFSINEGHDGYSGIVPRVKTKEEAIKKLKTWIEDSKAEDGELKKFRDVKWIGETDEEALDNQANKYEDQYIVAGTIDGEMHFAYWRRS